MTVVPPLPGLPAPAVTPAVLPPQSAAAQLSVVAADLARALADEEGQPVAPVLLLDRACELTDALSWALCREPAGFPAGGLAEIARSRAVGLCAAREQVRDTGAADYQAAVVTSRARAAGRAYQHWADSGRRPGQQARLAGQIAGLLIDAAVLAVLAGIDIDAAIGASITRPPFSGPAGTLSAGEADGDRDE